MNDGSCSREMVDFCLKTDFDVLPTSKAKQSRQDGQTSMQDFPQLRSELMKSKTLTALYSLAAGSERP